MQALGSLPGQSAAMNGYEGLISDRVLLRKRDIFRVADEMQRVRAIHAPPSIPSYPTARPSRDRRAAAWQQITAQWGDEARPHYELFTSELVLVEASAGDSEAAGRRLDALQGMAELPIDREVQELAEALTVKGGVPSDAEADAFAPPGSAA